MAQSGFTPISIYYSTTASAVPTAANLVQGELAINTADGKLYYEDSSGVVQVLATKSTGSIGGSNTQVQFNNSGSLGGSSSFTWDGTTVTATKFAGALNGTVGATTPAAGTFTSLSDSGNLTFTGTGNRITGDLSNATASNKVMFQTSTANSTTSVEFIPNGTGTSSSLVLSTNSDPTNETFLQLFSSQTEGRIAASGRGTFSYLPMTFYTGGSERLRIDTSGNVGIGTSSPSSYGRLAVMTPTANNGLFGIANSVGGAGGVNMAQYYGTVKTSYIDNTLENGTPGSETARLTFATINSGTLTERMRIDSSGNVGIGVTPSAWGSPFSNVMQFTKGAIACQSNSIQLMNNSYYNGTDYKYVATAGAGMYEQTGGLHVWSGAASGSAGATISFSERMRIDSSGNLLVGTTTAGAGIGVNTKLAVDAGSIDGAVVKVTGGVGFAPLIAWNTATTGDNTFASFNTEGGTGTQRGTITYNRAGGLVSYNVTSDYRAKDIIGSVTNSGEVIDSVPVYMGKMKDATQERPMFIAHETPVYAHTGGKDAVDADGKPVYQQMDASTLIPVMWAEIQSLRQRIKTLENK